MDSHHTPSPTVGATPPVLTAPLAGCVTIDATSPDGYLDNARKGTPKALANTTTKIAANNLFSCAGHGPTVAAIVGHGDNGVIGTGAGQSPGTIDQHMDTANETNWGADVAKLKGLVTDLYLYGCHTGAADFGAQLLYDIAKLINANVYAPTGLIYCDSSGNFSLEPDSQWQMATPSTKPPPINPPKGTLGAVNEEVILHHLGNQLVLALDQMGSARYTARDGERVLEGDEALTLAHEVAWDNPQKLEGEPGAMISGRLEVTFGMAAQPLVKSYLVYNHTLIRDEEHSGVVYRATPHFRELALRK